jgi:hypothetical protein
MSPEVPKPSPAPSARAVAFRRARDGLLLAGCLVAVIVGLRLVPPRAAPAEAAAPAASSAPSPPAPTTAARGTSAPPPTLELTPRDCFFEDRGLGDYVRASTKSGAKVLARGAAVGPDGAYDLVLHFHGADPVARILAPEGKPVVIAALDRGDSSRDYQGAFPTAAAFDALLAEIDGVVSSSLGRPARAARVLLSSFSAGYRASHEILAASPTHPSVTGVALLDSLYASYRGGTREVDADALAPFEAAGRRALSEPRFAFILTHSEVATDGYASTAEVATTLLDRLVVRSSLVKAGGERGLTRTAEERGFFVRGYGGADKGAHCAHLGLLPEVVDLWRGTK